MSYENQEHYVIAGKDTEAFTKLLLSRIIIKLYRTADEMYEDYQTHCMMLEEEPSKSISDFSDIYILSFENDASVQDSKYGWFNMEEAKSLRNIKAFFLKDGVCRIFLFNRGTLSYGQLQKLAENLDVRIFYNWASENPEIEPETNDAQHIYF